MATLFHAAGFFRQVTHQGLNRRSQRSQRSNVLSLRPLRAPVPIAAVFVVLCACLLWCGVPAAAEETPLKVMFLGDRGLHRPVERFRLLQPALALRGVELTYTERVDDLNRETLSEYGALLRYANIERILPEQEQALFEYVANGGGFAPVHCASPCFLNSPKYIELVGAQFRRHTAGIFSTRVAEPDHPVMRGYAPF